MDTCACGCGTPLSSPNLIYLNGHHRRRLRAVVEDRGYDTPCLIAQGKLTKGYVMTSRSVSGVVTKLGAHVRAWQEAHGRTVPSGMVVHHRCEQARCINPEHLQLVTQAENVRMGRGTKLTIEQVREIRSSPLPATVLAERFGISKWTAWKVRRGHLWADAK